MPRTRYMHPQPSAAREPAWRGGSRGSRRGVFRRFPTPRCARGPGGGHRRPPALDGACHRRRRPSTARPLHGNRRRDGRPAPGRITLPGHGSDCGVHRHPFPHPRQARAGRLAGGGWNGRRAPPRHGTLPPGAADPVHPAPDHDRLHHRHRHRESASCSSRTCSACAPLAFPTTSSSASGRTCRRVTRQISPRCPSARSRWPCSRCCRGSPSACLRR